MNKYIFILINSLILAPVTHALDYEYTIDGGTVTITDYIGSGGAIIIPDTIEGLPVTSIDSYAFRDYTSLISVVLPSNLLTIERNAFRDCTNLRNVLFPDGLEVIDGGFYNCSSLTNIVIPDSVTTLGNYAFKLCSSLTDVTIPNSVTNLGPYVFQGCSSLTNFTLPNTVHETSSMLFADCTGLTQVTIPDHILSIGRDSFNDCTSLTSVLLPEGITNISYAFRKCSSLTDIEIPDSVQNIDNAFNGCSSLCHLTIPSSITSIGSYTFQDCTSLTGLYFKGSAPTVTSSTTFNNVSSNLVVYYVPNQTGWGATYQGFSTELWLPRLETGTSPDSQCTIVWAKGLEVVVEACESLTSEPPKWQSIQTVTLSGDYTPFTDTQSTNHTTRFYRLSLP